MSASIDMVQIESSRAENVGITSTQLFRIKANLSMAGLYKTDKERLADVVTANSFKAFSVLKTSAGKDILVPASDYERQLHKEDSAAAVARLAIDSAMKAMD